MAKQNINVGTTANDKKGDSLRAAFQKVNANFTELYTALGLTDVTLNLGAFTFTGSTMSTDDSTAIVIDKPITVNGEITVDGDITPKTNLGASLGTPTKQFKSLYVSTNTVFLGGVPLSLEAGTNELTINNVPISQTINYTDIPNAPKDLSDLTDNDGSLGGGVTSYNDLTNKPTLFSGSYNDLTDKPNLAGTYQFSVAADDSTQRLVSTDEVIKFIGAGGITTASDAEGNITITGSAGSVSSLVNGAYTASLGNTGALTLPAGGIISEGGGLTGAIKLRPAGGANANQALLIYPTAGGDGDHIHLTAGGGSTELYLGNDSRYVKLVNDGDIAVLANNGAANRVYNWVGQGGWNQGSYTAVATTGGTGTGLTVNVAAGGAGYINITAITINNPGTGYTAGDVITINNENNLPGTFQIGIAANNWTFGTDGTLASNEFKIKTLNGIPNSINTPSITDTQFWDLNYGTGLATTGGSGTGLTVNVSDGGSGYASITINTSGTGYSPGDVITVTNGPFNGAPIASSATFTIGISGTHNWTFNKDGNIAPPVGSGFRLVNGTNQSRAILTEDQILSQVSDRLTRNFSDASNNEDFISATSNGSNQITFVGLDTPTKKFLQSTLNNYGVSTITVRLNGAGPEYGYSSFNGTDQIGLAGAGGDPIAPAGAVTSIRFSYTQASKIDIDPDTGLLEIRSAPGIDINIMAGDDIRMQATEALRLRSEYDNVTITTNYQVVGATEYTWTFGTGGELNLPNGAVLRNTLGNAIAFGQGAGLNSQGAEAVAIGINAGYDFQGANAVAIGVFAGETSQGANAIAIGNRAGFVNQAANSIIINATGATLDQTTANTFTVAPIRNISATSGVLQYNASTKEVSYSNSVTAETFNTDQITVVGNRISTTVTNANLELECNGTGSVVVNGGKLILNTGGNAYVESVDYGLNSANSAVNIFGGPYQKINLRAGFGTEATWTLATDGRTTFPNGTVPARSYGAAGDKEGMVVFSDPYIYYCKQDYVNNSTDIWVRVAWTGTSW